MKCPLCHNTNILSNSYSYHCNHITDNGSICPFFIWKSWYGLDVDLALLENIIINSPGGIFINSLLSSSGKIFSAYVYFNYELNKLDFTQHLLNVVCPLCGDKVLKSEQGYFCASSCGFSLFKDNKGIIIDDRLAIKLLSGAKSNFILNLKTRNSVEYAGRLYLDPSSFNLMVDSNICKCLKCNIGYVSLSQGVYRCTNFKMCDFKSYKEVKGYNISIQDILNLSKSGSVGTVTCTSLKGVSYLCELYLDNSKKITFKPIKAF